MGGACSSGGPVTVPAGVVPSEAEINNAEASDNGAPESKDFHNVSDKTVDENAEEGDECEDKEEDEEEPPVENPSTDDAPYPPDYTPPLPTEIVGTYSTHGLMPQPFGMPPVKVNQDYGTLLYPFGGENNQVNAI